MARRKKRTGNKAIVLSPVRNLPEKIYWSCRRRVDEELKLRYRSLADAERVAEIKSVSYGQNWVGYECRCGYYHIGRPLPAGEDQDGAE